MDAKQKRLQGLLRQITRVEGRLVGLRRQSERLTAVRVPCAPVNNLAEALTDEQVLERVPLNLDGARYDWVFGPVQWQGGYSVTSASERAHARSFAVNIDHRESEPARASKDSFPDRVRFENDLSIPTEVTPVTVGPRESQLFRCILSFVLLLMLIEPLWADRVGGRL